MRQTGQQSVGTTQIGVGIIGEKNSGQRRKVVELLATCVVLRHQVFHTPELAQGNNSMGIRKDLSFALFCVSLVILDPTSMSNTSWNRQISFLQKRPLQKRTAPAISSAINILILY